jgi:hypothetical protein
VVVVLAGESAYLHCKRGGKENPCSLTCR